LIGAAAVLAAIPAISAGGPGELVAKDTGRGKSPVAVAIGEIRNPGEMRLVISTKPANKKVAWSYTTDCSKGDGRLVRYPPPGQHVDKISRSKVRRRMQSAVPDPEFCKVSVSAKLDFKSGKKVTAKIFNK
jgi:hypothetical protein